VDATLLRNPAIFLVDTLVSLYIFALMLRFLFQWVEADFYNPISQALVKITHPLLRPLRRLLPSIGRIDTASVVLMLVVQMLGGYLIFLIQGVDFSVGFLAIWAVSQVLELFFNVFLFAIIAVAILSWISPMPRNAAVSLLLSLTQPVLRQARRIVPPIGGVDISPVLVFIAIQFCKMLVMPTLQQLAATLNF
jgi:YggT family protein